MISPDPLVFYVAVAAFAMTFTLGVGVQFGLLDTGRFGWVHHGLFFLTAATAALAAVTGLVAGAAYGPALIPVLALYVLLPRVRAGTAGHAAIACAALVLYAVGLIMTVR